MIPIQLQKIINKLNQENFIQILSKYSKIYLIGGSVRDSFLDKIPKDIDIIIEGLSLDEIQNILKHHGKVSIVGKSFAVIKFKPKNWNEDIDIAVPREDKKIGKGHKGIEVYTGKHLTIFDDLKRRDITINSIAIDLNKNIIDPFNGLLDLKNKIIKATSLKSFLEDPLRMLRVIGFSARFHFDIDENTLALMKSHAFLIKDISGERIREEFDKIINKRGSTQIAFEILEKSNMDKALFGKKFDKSKLQYLDNLDMVSFYYVLGTLGNVLPSKFYKEKLKGEFPITKALMTLEKHFMQFYKSNSEQEIRWNVFLMLKSSSLLQDAKVLPENVSKIIEEMKAKKIPMKMGDIPVTGNDIMETFGVKNEEVGNIMSFMYQNALMNRFDWKSKEKTLEYLKNI